MGTGRGDTEGGGAQHSSQSHCHCVCYVCTGLGIGGVWGLGEGVQRGAGLSTRVSEPLPLCVLCMYRAGDRKCMGTGRGGTEGSGAQHSSQSHCLCQRSDEERTVSGQQPCRPRSAV